MQSLSRKNLALVSNPEYVTLEAIPSKSQRKTLDVIPHEKSKLTTKNVKHEKMISAIRIAALRMETNAQENAAVAETVNIELGVTANTCVNIFQVYR